MKKRENGGDDELRMKKRENGGDDELRMTKKRENHSGGGMRPFHSFA
jgi:hypothetical protein